MFWLYSCLQSGHPFILTASGKLIQRMMRAFVIPLLSRIQIVIADTHRFKNGGVKGVTTGQKDAIRSICHLMKGKKGGASHFPPLD